MARLDDIPQPTRDAMVAAPCPAFETELFVAGPQLAQRRVAIVSCAALIRRGDRFHGASSVIGPSTENNPMSKSATIRKNGSVGLGSDMALSYHQSHDVIMCVNWWKSGGLTRPTLPAAGGPPRFRFNWGESVDGLAQRFTRHHPPRGGRRRHQARPNIAGRPDNHASRNSGLTRIGLPRPACRSPVSPAPRSPCSTRTEWMCPPLHWWRADRW